MGTAILINNNKQQTINNRKANTMEQLAQRIYNHIMNWVSNQDPEELDGTPLEIPLSDFECEDDFIIESESGEVINCSFDEVANVCLFHMTYNVDEEFSPEIIFNALEDGMEAIYYDPDSYCFYED